MAFYWLFYRNVCNCHVFRVRFCIYVHVLLCATSIKFIICAFDGVSNDHKNRIYAQTPSFQYEMTAASSKIVVKYNKMEKKVKQSHKKN